MIHRAHTGLAICRDNAVDLMGLLLADKVADRRIHAHDLESRNFRAVERRHELLAYHCLQDHRKLHADLALLIRRERIKDTVDRVRAARSV